MLQSPDCVCHSAFWAAPVNIRPTAKACCQSAQAVADAVPGGNAALVQPNRRPDNTAEAAALGAFKTCMAASKPTHNTVNHQA